MNYVDGIILGLVQGITEFLPISSSGHLVLVRDMLMLSDVNALAFDAMLHFATTAAILVYFRSDIWTLCQTVLRKLGRLPVNERDMTMIYALLLGTIPAAVVGLLFEPVVELYLNTALVVGTILFIASLFFMYAEWRYFLNPRTGQLTVRIGVLVGCFQVLALLPGFSRAGATIAGGMLLGLSRYESARFSFLLSIPITLAVGSKMTLELMAGDSGISWTPMLMAAGVAFVSALIVIHFFLSFIRKYTLWPFVWYGIGLSGLVFYVTLFT